MELGLIASDCPNRRVIMLLRIALLEHGLVNLMLMDVLQPIKTV